VPGRSTKVTSDRQRGEAYVAQVLDNLTSVTPGGRNAALNRAAWTLGRWVAAGALEQAEVEDGLYAAASQNGLVADDGERQTCLTIRSGLSAGLQQAVDLDPKQSSIALCQYEPVLLIAGHCGAHRSLVTTTCLGRWPDSSSHRGPRAANCPAMCGRA
jgi:hypothetical protein